MGSRKAISATIALLLCAMMMIVLSARQTPAIPPMDEKALGEYAGVYRWEPNAFVYLQLWKEFVGFDKPSQLVAFDESGEVRTLYPADRDQFFAGPGMAVSSPIESRIEFQRDGTGKIASLTWRRNGAAARTARPGRDRKTGGDPILERGHSAGGHADPPSDRRRETSRRHSRPRFRRRESGVHRCRGHAS